MDFKEDPRLKIARKCLALGWIYFAVYLLFYMGSSYILGIKPYIFGLPRWVAIGIAMFQPRLIQWIIFFSIGGLVSATFGPILLGMHWKRGNKWGTMASITWGMIIYGLAYTVVPQLKVWGTHPSFISVITSIIVYVVVSLATSKPSAKVALTFWGQPNKI